MKTGKLDWEQMKELFSLLPTEDEDLVLGPSRGEDAAIIRLRDGYLIAHVDPITTGVRRLGYLSIIVAANDIAVRGAIPKWFLITFLIPPHYRWHDIREIFEDAGEAARRIGGVIVGGHTEVTPGLPRPIAVVTSIGYSLEKPIMTRDARPGDAIYVVGRIGGEGAGVIAWDFEEKLLSAGISKDVIELAKGYIYDISVVEVALRLRKIANSMHDATEGGILQAIREIAVASGLGAQVDLDAAELEGPVEAITTAMEVDPYRLLSSGCLVASVPPSKEEELLAIARDLGKPAVRVGEFIRGELAVLIKRAGARYQLDKDVVDEIYKLWR